MKINKERLWRSIHELGRIGKNDDGSITRLAYTKEDQEACKFIEKKMRDAGLDVEYDYCGNIIGTLKSRNESEETIVCGSHFDSVKNGGIFDGCLGVLGAIEALQTMGEHNIRLKHNIKVIGFRDEEGNRFGHGMVGSRSISGLMEAEGFKSIDENGVSLGEAIDAAGYNHEFFENCVIDNIRSYFELHIEQGAVLESNDKSVGIVEGIAGLHRYTVIIEGKADHAGATPMNLRHDPVVAMSKWISEVTRMVKTYKNTVVTVGELEVQPGAFNIICSSVKFSLDLRALEVEIINAILEDIEKLNKIISKDEKVSIKLEKNHIFLPASCDLEIRKNLTSFANDLNIKSMPIMSGAGHDAMQFKDRCKIAMVFVRSMNDGASHSKYEYSTIEDCANGVQLLCLALEKEGMGN